LSISLDYYPNYISHRNVVLASQKMNNRENIRASTHPTIFQLTHHRRRTIDHDVVASILKRTFPSLAQRSSVEMLTTEIFQLAVAEA
jgi:hypothetical protein